MSKTACLQQRRHGNLFFIDRASSPHCVQIYATIYKLICSKRGLKALISVQESGRENNEMENDG